MNVHFNKGYNGYISKFESGRKATGLKKRENFWCEMENIWIASARASKKSKSARERERYEKVCERNKKNEMKEKIDRLHPRRD